uniref:Replication protein A C-terminal domain-containing protein n=1 Tax=Pyramimonas obovata TaxID=1411642 RepID=A0A7S0WS52_9CHLO|mmetsp:Transcript_37328/g.81304  ORF Transcript_37328/g.81304 Transcript_37328/m.81304 type:complete len:289 (+) Transcript_37328:118-984(+)|eukprot:CAMPEP_0118933948 /NCGR_PEP_ID=MMETSP1169-20130426/13091_1 /TAXON_ID=36882 /ORGANISM="Pyramimonas obovata, Strain CCMP722" /LENGTH=288 /DNA_ID=CAMNT_0006876789 /DNA_START=112 /DNA_END=978 /DNA_ORIENTATION=+
MYNGDYGGADSQFGGGGFMPSPTGGAATGASPGVKAGGGGQKNESLTPLTVRQLHEALQGGNVDESLTVDGDDLHSLTLVGKVVDAQDSSTMLSYTLDDGTGKVEVRMWLDDEGDLGQSMSGSGYAKGTYVRVYGNLRTFQNQRNIVAFQIRPVVDFNEVTFHLLEAIFVHTKRTKAMGMGAGAPTTPNVKFNPNAPANYQTPVPAYNGNSGANNNSNGMEACQDKVMRAFETPQAATNEAGLSVDSLVQELGSMFSKEQIRTAVETLVNDGHLYSTIDDNHYKSTNC